MAAGKIAHSGIAGNILREVGNLLKDHPCQVFGGDAAVKTTRAHPFRLPDVSVVCGDPVIEDFQGVEMLVNPLLICEVLSPSTASYDREEKFMVYQGIESFQEYLLVEQDRPHVTRYVRQTDGQWLRADIIGLESAVRLETLGVELQLSEIYRMIKFPAEAEATESGHRTA
ncbi:MAG: Uma2 family endonuclease [Acidobacteria bacterium]|nr:Uma2 family endonuclease [Acidobacteriota bacterium]